MILGTSSRRSHLFSGRQHADHRLICFSRTNALVTDWSWSSDMFPGGPAARGALSRRSSTCPTSRPHHPSGLLKSASSPIENALAPSAKRETWPKRNLLTRSG
eukprot:10975482-Heterocapsa_arctica.AAC.1